MERIRIRKNKFVKDLMKSSNPKIVKRWQFSGMIDGKEYCNKQYTKEQFLKFLAFANNYEVMRVDAQGGGVFDVYDKFGGAIYSFDVELR